MREGLDDLLQTSRTAGRRPACRRSRRTTRPRTTASRTAGTPELPRPSWSPCSPATAAGSSSPRCSNSETLNSPSEYENCSDFGRWSWWTSYSCSDAGSVARAGPALRPQPVDLAQSRPTPTPPGAIGGRCPRNSRVLDLQVGEHRRPDHRLAVGAEQLPLQQQPGRLVDPEPRRQRLVGPQRLDQYRGPPDRVRAALVDQLVRRLEQRERSAVDSRAAPRGWRVARTPWRPGRRGRADQLISDPCEAACTMSSIAELEPCGPQEVMICVPWYDTWSGAGSGAFQPADRLRGVLTLRSRGRRSVGGQGQAEADQRSADQHGEPGRADQPGSAHRSAPAQSHRLQRRAQPGVPSPVEGVDDRHRVRERARRRWRPRGRPRSSPPEAAAQAAAP